MTCRVCGKNAVIFLKTGFYCAECEPKMDYTPKQIIEQAREKAQKALIETCSAEIQRICEAFSYDTGLFVSSVNFDFVETTAIGSGGRTGVVVSARIGHELL